MKTKRPKSNWILDALLFAGLIISFAMDWTGLPMHQWIGVFGGLLASYHLILHWDWVTAVTMCFLGRTSGQARIYYLLDAAILVGFYLIVASGIIISTWLNLTLVNYSSLVDFHVTTSIMALILVVLKISLHWRWIVRVARHHIFRPVPQSAQGLKAPALRSAAAPAVGSGAINRRDFLKLMGTVGVASLAAITFTLNGDDEAQSATSNGENVSASETYSSSNATEADTTSCTVQCNKRCSFPGNCHRYQDTNGNNRCDFGECA